MRCPICKKEVVFGDANMPFCSDRCREIDLGNWATGKYVIPGPEPFEGQEQPDEIETDEGPIQ